MTTPVITRYGKIVPIQELTPVLKASLTSEPPELLKNLGPHSAKFQSHFLQKLVFIGEFGSAVIYPVRLVDTYVLSINKTSHIFSSNQLMLKYLINREIITYSDELSNQFKEYAQLDFESIANLTTATVRTLSSDGKVVRKNGTFSKAVVSELSRINYIPCMHEKKVFIEAFLETKFITPDFRAKLQKAKMKQFDSCFIPTSEVMEEILKDIDI